ncbi:MAG: RNA polymerase-associated protein RapA [Acidobacteria bacterium]|nr:RNA polymerase-associated protein RapA [Acidobacteriota bacterium]
MTNWAIGQRCLSLGEPTLGLGAVKKLAGRTLEVHFPAAGVSRTYTARDPPLHRVAFHPGDVVTDRSGSSLEIQEVKEQNGILFYIGASGVFPETELSDTLSSTHPEQVLLAAQLQTPRSFAVRRDSWRVRHASLTSDVRGLVGARIELVPHQLYIANRVGRRHRPRVLLADEVGLGKTVEAGLIFHQQWVTGQLKRILVLTPETLVFQWLVELYRKFNHLFHLMDHNYFQALQESQPDLNPYECHQRFIQGINPLLRHPEGMEAILQVQWDMIIVDEAHHLEWSLDGASPAYQLVEKLARRTESLILISATPRQLGLESHFALLRLLDPNRFHDLEQFLDETENLDAIAQLVDQMEVLPFEQWRELLENTLPEDAALTRQARAASGKPAEKQALVQNLIDRHGTGRMVYRNRREVLATLLPQRRVHPYPLTLSESGRQFLAAFDGCDDFTLAQEALSGSKGIPLAIAAKRKLSKRVLDEAWAQDPRLPWLIDLVKKNSGSKFVLICSSAATVLAIQEALFPFRDIQTGVFHENLNLVERDRQAAWFAEEGGAQILLCSEIGSEGRNFQFAHHLILFDLPFDPGLLEQRIGRLDRIGQHHEIQIHIPYSEGTLHHRLYRWYREGLGAFDQPVNCADQLASYLDEELGQLIDGQIDLDELIETTRLSLADLTQVLEKGRDTLLERHSFNRDEARSLIERIESDSIQGQLPGFMERLFEILGLQTSPMNEDVLLVEPGNHMFIESYPEIPREGIQVTYNRNLAVAREDLAFLTMDHPIVTSGLDLMLSQDRGVASMGLWKKAPEPGLLLQMLFLVECHAKEFLGIDRYLPPTPIEILLDQNMKERSDLLVALEEVVLDKGPSALIRNQRSALEDIFTRLIQVARQSAKKSADQIIEAARTSARQKIQSEYKRLQALRSLNPSVRVEELEYYEALGDLVDEQLSIASLRMDAIRLILMKP